jgi:threonine dehydratase
MALLTIPAVTLAAKRIQPHVSRTELTRVPGMQLWIKPEHQQPTGSFKIRGAVNAIARLAASATRTPLVAQSSGNHGRAVAYAARRFGLSATVVLPDTAPRLKLDAIRRLGATVLTVPPADREAAAIELCLRQRGALVSSDDLDVIAGQATVGLEIALDLPKADVILVPVCNGGLLAGIAAAVKASNSATRIIGVEPELAGDAADSFRQGKLIRWPTEGTYRTVADGLRAPSLGANAWDHIKSLVDGMVTVTERSIGDAMGVLLDEVGVVAEPAGAVAIAGFLSRRDVLPTGKTVAVISGGNVEAATYHSLTGRYPPENTDSDSVPA